MVGDKLGESFPAATLFAPMISVFSAMAEWIDADRHRFEQASVGGETQSPPDSQQSPLAADLLLPVGQAMIIAANRSVTYWLGLAQVFESHYMTFAQVMSVAAIDGRTGGSERLVVADRLRELLREVGDLATREARILQNELSALDESLAQSLQQSEPPDSYHRRWRTKV